MALITNNSIVKTIALSPVFKFNDPTDGAANKIAVQNRVKKMSQAERKELMQDLDHVIGNNVASLKERGLCTLLLSDNGKMASKSWFIVSFVCGFLNLIGARTGSSAIMQKLEQTKSFLDTNIIAPPALNVKGELETEIARIKQEIQDQAPAEKNVQVLIGLINEIRATDLKDLRGADWDKIGTFVNLEESLEVLKQRAGVSDAANLINDSIKVIKELILKPSDSHGSFNKNKENIIGLISFGLKKLEVRLEDQITSIHNKKEKLQESHELVQKRLSKFEKNNLKGSERKLFGDSQVQIKNAAKQIKILDEICEAIETLSKKKANFLVLATAIKSINSHLQTSSDDIKNVQNFGQDFAILAQFAAGDLTLNKQHLANVIDINVLTAHSRNAELHGRLVQFKADPNHNFPNSDEQKKQLINDYVDYWGILFTGLREQQQRILETEKAKLAPKKAPQPVQAPEAPKPVSSAVAAPVAAAPVNAGSLPPKLNIPGSGHAKLIAIARGLQDVRESAAADYAWYGQLTTIEESVAKKVYGNFYRIMKGLNQLGSLNADRESIDPAWGTNVFTTGKSNNVAPAIPRPLLNHYRVQAIVEALTG